MGRREDGTVEIVSMLTIGMKASLLEINSISKMAF